MGADLRTRLRSELRPPPLGDIVGTAVRDGKRIRRIRRIGAGIAVAGAVAIATSAGRTGPAPSARAIEAAACADQPAVTPAALLEQVADVLEVLVSVVKSQTKRSLVKLRELLADDQPALFG